MDWNWLYLALPLGLSVLFSFAVAGWRPQWPVWRTSLVSAAFLPAPIFVLGMLVVINVLLTPAEKCGVDACGMGAMAGMFFAGGALMLFLVGGAINFAIHALMNRS
ncbi:hypothetical protein HZY97_02225 [Sphingomonas sp. R-74633]|uniref:hypothetical protein n=1 Tax=Sphingomonas sp. R-74633 TaxID=2751188 RepID=UPI0015D158B5|nr:hypothetical protein [Sphingomonas sp. R-74633]NYT39559.1 hypothetical protein [Sphingomonas sp. R-74633]